MNHPNDADNEKGRNNPESAVSNTVGIILLISVVLIAVSIIGVRMLSAPVAQEIPVIDADISSDTSHIYILHNGGDTVSVSHLKVYLDESPTTTFSVSSGNSWHIGNVLVIPYTGSLPSRVTVVYAGPTGAEAVLATRYLRTGSAAVEGPQRSG